MSKLHTKERFGDLGFLILCRSKVLKAEIRPNVTHSTLNMIKHLLACAGFAWALGGPRRPLQPVLSRLVHCHSESRESRRGDDHWDGGSIGAGLLAVSEYICFRILV